MINVNLNADLGEGTNIEKLIMPFLSSCSIACGGHTGNANTMSEAIQIAIESNVKIGAHPSYPDKDGFGRIPISISNKDLTKSLISQINSLNQILNDFKIDCQVIASQVDEDEVKQSLLAEGADPLIISKNLAEIKSIKVSSKNPDRLVIGADSVISLHDQLINKPRSRDEAFSILKKLNNSCLLYTSPSPRDRG